MSRRWGEPLKPEVLSEVDRLLAMLANDELTAADAERLEMLVRTNPEARQRFISGMGLMASLEWEAGGADLAANAIRSVASGGPKPTDSSPNQSEGGRSPPAPPAPSLFEPRLFGSPDAGTQGDPPLSGQSFASRSADLPQGTEPRGTARAHESTEPAPGRKPGLGFLADNFQQFLFRPLPLTLLVLGIVLAATVLSPLVTLHLLGVSQRQESVHVAEAPAATTSDNPDAHQPVRLVGRVAPAESTPAIHPGTSEAANLPGPSTTPGSPATVARLTGTWDAIWTDRATAPKEGASLVIGQRLSLVGGLAEITFNCGAVVIVQAPATFALEAENGGTLISGRLTARVPGPASKFWVQTPSMKVLDLGTEFGVAAEPSGASQVHVFAGAVEVEPAAQGSSPEQNSKSRRLLLAGQVGRVEPYGDFAKVPRTVNPGTFIRNMPDNAVANYMRSILASQPWGYWNFNSTITSTLIPDVTGNGRFGQLIGGAMVVQGGSVLAVGPAVSLSGAGDLVLVPTGATLSMRQDFSFEVLFRTTDDGTILAKAPADKDWGRGSKSLYVLTGKLQFNAYGAGVLQTHDQIDDGQWHHVVVTNHANGNGSHDDTYVYVDGVERAHRNDWKITNDPDDEMPLKFGFTEANFPAKSYFSGDLDEVAVYQRCLTREEVESHYWAYLQSGMAARGAR